VEPYNASGPDILRRGYNVRSFSAPIISCSYICLLAGVIVTGGCSREQAVEKTVPFQVKHEAVSATTHLATISKEEQPDIGVSASDHGKERVAEGQILYHTIVLNRYGKGVAYIARIGEQVRVVHNGKPGRSYQEIDAMTLSLSPDGQRAAFAAKDGDKWLMVVDGRERGPFDDKGPPVFSPDSKHVAFEAKTGESWHILADDRKSSSAVSYYGEPVFSGDSSRLLRIENTKEDGMLRFVVSDLSFKKQDERVVQGGAYAVNEDGTLIAVIQRIDTQQRVLEFRFDKPDTVKEGTAYDEIRDLVFSRDGALLAYFARRGGIKYVTLNGREERVPEGEYLWPPVIRPQGKGVGMVIVGKKGAYVHQAFSNDVARAPNRYKECADLVYNSDGQMHAYVAIRNEKFLIVANGKEGPMFDRVITPQFSPDGKFLVYRARQDGKRFVVVADAKGNILREHPRYERVFETVFTADGKSVAYGVKDGQELIWKVENLSVR
jgi:WD40 repeat protein